jgi:hypothetical protein
MRTLSLKLCALIALAIPFAAQADEKPVVCTCKAEPCLRLTHDVELEGTLTTREGGAFILNLDQPKCAIGTHDPKDDFDGADLAAQTMFHVAFLEDGLAAKGSKAVGHRVKLKGYPFGWETAWHLTPIMFGAKAIEIVK